MAENSLQDRLRRWRRWRIVLSGALAWGAVVGGGPVVGAITPEQAATRPAEWYEADEGRRLVSNVLTWQNANGGWPKGYDAATQRPANDDVAGWRATSTIDNNATCSELRVLARAMAAGDAPPATRAAVERGVKFLLTAQHPTGGWPQRFPLEDNYGRYATFNDDATVRVMSLLRDVADAREPFAFVDEAQRGRCRAAFDRGIEFILRAQIETQAGPTVWCQQHDPVTYVPQGARSYELPSLSGSESAGILMLLMELPEPNERVRRAVHAGARWFERSAIDGKRLERRADARQARGFDLVLVDDPAAERLWARFYDIDTNRPFYCGRDGVKRWSLAEIEPERRTGYAWLRPWGKPVLTAYAAWASRHGAVDAQRD